jgi:hypothetical protein
VAAPPSAQPNSFEASREGDEIVLVLPPKSVSVVQLQ